MTDRMDEGGAWALIDHLVDFGETITAIFPTELDALRELNVRGYGRVAFVPWGKTPADIA